MRAEKNFFLSLRDSTGNREFAFYVAECDSIHGPPPIGFPESL